MSLLRKLLAIVLLFVIICIGFLWFWHNYYFIESNKGLLKNYSLVNGPIAIAESAQQSSGLAYNPDLNQLYVIVNEPPQIHILSADGLHLSKIDLIGFKDTEGISYLGDDKFAIVSERSATISWFTLKQNTQFIKFSDIKSIKLFPQNFGNTGLEGISFAQQLNKVFIVKERKPKKIISLQWPVNETEQPIIESLWDAEDAPWWSMRNFSGIHFEPKTEHLFILSRRSRRIVEYTLSGQEVGSFSLKAGSAGLNKAIAKAEGIVISNDGTLYICGEPNQLYIFKERS